MQIRASLQRVRGEFVFSQPKTARSRRQIQLTESVVAVLRRHRASQIKERLANWKAPAPHYTSGVFAKYAASVLSASEGAVTIAKW